MSIFLWAILAFIIGSLIEWIAHKFVLHNFKIKSLSRYHFGRHHRRARQNEGYDSDYFAFPPRKWESGMHEIAALFFIIIAALPLALVSIWLWIFLCAHACAYYYLHRRMHVDPSWGRKWFPWHWRHHMGKNQNKNWGVTNPMFDYLFGTVEK